MPLQAGGALALAGAARVVRDAGIRALRYRLRFCWRVGWRRLRVSAVKARSVTLRFALRSARRYGRRNPCMLLRQH